jgi:hypothetical protein
MISTNYAVFRWLVKERKSLMVPTSFHPADEHGLLIPGKPLTEETEVLAFAALFHRDPSRSVTLMTRVSP